MNIDRMNETCWIGNCANLQYEYLIKEKGDPENAIKNCIKVNYISSCRGKGQGGVSFSDAINYKPKEEEEKVINNTYYSLFKNKKGGIRIGQQSIMLFKKASKGRSRKVSSHRSKKASKRKSRKGSKNNY